MEIRGKNITVVGLGRSGVGAANLLSELGAYVTVTDRRPEEDLRDFTGSLNHPVRLALENHPENLFLSADMIVISPGVPLDILPISKAKEKGIPILGELELAYQIASNQSLQSYSGVSKVSSQIRFLAITGTNGKSTTTTLLNLMLKKAGFKTVLGGNIGNALTEEIYKRLGESETRRLEEVTVSYTRHVAGSAIGVDYIVAEVSSFQLESIKDFRPKGAVILNITPDHLDRYHSVDEYYYTKTRIFENQKEDDFLLLNADDPETMNLASEKLKARNEKPKIFYFSRKKKVDGIYFKDGQIYCNFPDSSIPCRHSSLINADEIKIKGVHNLENAMAASAMALLAGSPVEAIRNSIREFTGLEHRLELVKEVGGVRYFNDSKGTNVGAVVKSLESFKNPIILIAGGRDKGGDFSLLRDLVREKVNALVLIGEATEKIKKSLGDLTETVTAKNLREAVNISYGLAKKGDIVLLSPACASFDMFIDFEDRGRQFKKIVMELT
jgi:UDP-N-acetylmuramoylalanine--D-glutamate ligase